MNVAGRVITAAVCGAALSLAASPPSRAASPTIRATCDIPNSQDIVACRLSGRGFHAREAITITYRVIFTALPRKNGRLQARVFRRQGATDSHGAFARPPLRFAVARYHESFRLTVTVVGSRGDRTTATFDATAQ